MEGRRKPLSWHSNVNQINWLTKLKFVKARKLSSLVIQIVYTMHYEKKKVDNSGIVGKIKLGVIIMLYYDRLIV